MALGQALPRWQGLGVSPGIVAGPAHLIRTEGDFVATEEAAGAILVVRHATPAIFPSLVRARAAVCETGGMLSHLAILSRELGKPCVTGLRGIVDALEAGALLRVDGTAGVVEVLSPGRHESDGVSAPAAGPAPPPAPDALTPLLQFGTFSLAFEHTRSRFDLEVAVRVAALVSLPMTVGGGHAAWEFAITDNRVLVATAALRATTATLVEGFAGGSLRSGRLRDRYLALCTWPSWTTLADPPLDPGRLRRALRRFVELNQLTWIAGVAKEPLTERYRFFLEERLANVEATTREQLLLDSLIMPDRSYIMRSWLHERGAPTVWSTVGMGDHRGEVAAARTLTDEAHRRREGALRRLAEALGEPSFARAMRYVDTLDDLVDLTERKNSDLHRCGRALFGDERMREAIAQLIGIGRTDGTGLRSADDSRDAVEHVLTQLKEGGALEPMTED